MKKAFESVDSSEIKNLSSYYDKLYDLYNKNKYKHISALATIYIARLENENYNNKSVAILQEYLFSCEKWTYYEVRLSNNSIFYMINLP
ncbi:hypothetical protein [Alkalibacterium sp. 20]|uniref:Rgg family transcriptional regulator n=1 Tax=Alkalibacterium sp. 20 TaxID=1798803 RepID=UPI00090004C8|nr:hypothetical protein [Alkalibacterium sp. 20]OJF90458.1 hypothetical protein AX762_11710 [Alkalibacterium sp. 20]